MFVSRLLLGNKQYFTQRSKGKFTNHRQNGLYNSVAFTTNATYSNKTMGYLIPFQNQFV